MRRLWTAALSIVLIVAVAPRGEAAERLRVGVLKLASSGGVFIAAERGYFTAQGVEVELRFFDAAQPIAVAAVAAMSISASPVSPPGSTILPAKAPCASSPAKAGKSRAII